MKSAKIVFISLLGIIWLLMGCSSGDTQIESFQPGQVTLLPSPFTKARAADLKYMMKLDPDRLLAPFLKESGLTPKGKIYGNWEGTGLGGHTAGHYLSALSRMYATTGNQESLDRLNYMVSEIKRCQDANGNGYVGGVPGGKEMWKEIAAGHIDAKPFSLNDKWVPWYNLHKLYAGLRDAYLYAGNQEAKDVLVKLSDWSLNLVKNLSDDQIQEMLKTEQGGMNEVLADVSAITGDKKYLALAKRFSDRRILDPLMQQEDSLTGLHANTQIPKIIGYERISELDGDQNWHSAADFFWSTVVNNRSVVIGGNSVREHFNPKDDFSPMVEDRQGPETCNTYNMLRLTKMLYQDEGSMKYIDYYERAMFNHILSSENPDEGGFVYFTPMRPRHYRVYSTAGQDFWCCVGTGMENHTKYGALIYAHTKNALLVNMFVPSKVNWEDQGVTLIQNTQFPDQETSTLTVQTDSPKKFTLKVRHPNWVQTDGFQLLVNGEPVDADNKPDTYAAITRKWKAGDKVEIRIPMVTHVEQLPDSSDYYAIMRGPIVLAAKTSTNDLEGQFADDGRMSHVAHGQLYPLDEAPKLTGSPADFASKIKPVAGKPMTFTAADIITPQRYKNLELIPFFRLHEARYVIYWKHVTG